MKILWCCQYPSAATGYARVSFELLKRLKKYYPNKEDIMIYGIYPSNRPLLDRKKYVDENFLTEEAVDEVEVDFGPRKLQRIVKEYNPEIVVIYSDPWVVYNYCTLIKEVKEYTGKVIPYIDIIYLDNKKEQMKSINDCTDRIMCFSDFAKKELVNCGYKKPIYVVRHGINFNQFKEIPKVIAVRNIRKKMDIGLTSDLFLIQNFNRNQPRKRLDICIKAYAEFISKNPNAKCVLIFNCGSEEIEGWSLPYVLNNEFYVKRNIKDWMKHICILPKCHHDLPEEQLNWFYNACDIGINTCDSEGFGLINLEHASMGKPQIVGNFGGLGDNFDRKFSEVIEPNDRYVNPNMDDGVCGTALNINYKDVAKSIEKYYYNKKLRKKHGKLCKKIFKNDRYNWDLITDRFNNIIKTII